MDLPSLLDRKSSLIALIVGILIGISVLSLKHLEGGGGVGAFLILCMFPGMIVAMILSGNVHAFSLWVAAIANIVFYFALVRTVWFVVDIVKRKLRRRVIHI